MLLFEMKLKSWKPILAICVYVWLRMHFWFGCSFLMSVSQICETHGGLRAGTFLRKERAGWELIILQNGDQPRNVFFRDWKKRTFNGDEKNKAHAAGIRAAFFIKNLTWYINEKWKKYFSAFNSCWEIFRDLLESLY